MRDRTTCDRDAAEGSVAVRRRGTREQVDMRYDEFISLIDRLRSSRSLELN